MSNILNSRHGVGRGTNNILSVMKILAENKQLHEIMKVSKTSITLKSNLRGRSLRTYCGHIFPL